MIPPTVAGPMIVIPFFFATWRISRARWGNSQNQAFVFENFVILTLSGTPSAIIAIDLI